MNREIEFRGKRKDNNEWVYGYYLKTIKDNYHYIYNGDYSELVSIICGIETYEPSTYNMQIIEVLPKTIEQYTGLKDKNGKKIFEGDVCRGNSYSNESDLFIIKYGKYKTDDWKKRFGTLNTYQFGWYGEFIKDKGQVHLVIPNGIEVIGTIFDKEINNE